MSDIVDIAASQIGTSESNKGHMKYINWYGGFGSGTPWCAIFVSHCSNQAGIPTSIVPKFASVAVGMQWFRNNGLFKIKGSYTPKRGDIVFFTNNRSHTGIVEKVEGATLHTIEGNTSDKVARRTYSLDENTLTGYGTPKYSGAVGTTSTGSVGSSDKNKKNSAEELKYLKKVLKNKESKKPTIIKMDSKIEMFPNYKDNTVDILVTNGKKRFYVPVLDDMRITWERKGTPGKLTFKTIIDKEYPIQEGNNIVVKLDKKLIFEGFIFTKKTSKENILEITAYDQLRYLKNKDTLIYSNKTASQVIKMIAKDFDLRIGDIEDTKYVIPKKIEEDTTLFDMILNALDETMMMKNKLYILYDDVGKLTLKNVANMKVNNIIDSETAQDFDYKSSIDENTYNQIKLGYENTDEKKNKKTLDTYVVRDKNKMNQWGFLQYYEKIDDPKIAVLKANVLLQMYNKKTRSLSITDAIGNINVRAGSLIPVFLTLVDKKLRNYLLVEKVTHKFSNKVHTMDLTLSGGDFSV